MNKKLIIGNWKMNPNTLKEAKHIANKIRKVSLSLTKVDTVICPPFIYTLACSTNNRPPNFYIGAQSVSRYEGGPHTGEVSAYMLKDAGVEYVVVGHSEGRDRGETDSHISEKIRLVLEAGMKPVVCLGEKSRDSESGSHFDFLKEQIKNTFNDVLKKYVSDIILVYEPVWAVGASEPMMSEQIYEMVLFVKKVFSDIFDPRSALKTKVLYGGSVNFKNASDIIITGKVDGLLVGRESVNVTGFSELLRMVETLP